MTSKNDSLFANDSTIAPSQYSSPSTSRLHHANLSFANVRNRHKQGLPPPIYLSPRHTNSRVPECVRSPGSKAKGAYLAEAYQLENKSLKGTVEVLKQQIEALKGSYRMIKQKNKALKREQEDRQKHMEKKLQRYEEYKKKSHQYDQLVPKIEQLQILQDQVIEQNEQLKKKETKLKEVMAGILITIGNSHNETLSTIRNIIRQACSQQ